MTKPHSPKNAFSTGKPFKFDDAYVERVIRAYRLADSEYRQPVGSMWAHIADNYRQDMHETLLRGDRGEVSQLMGNPAENNLFFGADIICKWAIAQISEASFDTNVGIAAALTRLAEITGARRMWNPEANKEVGKEHDIDEILDILDRAFGTRIEIPNPFPGEFGQISPRGVISHRVQWALHHAWRVRHVAQLFGGSKVLEIGGGLGRVAFYARALGFRDYTIVDIPLTMVAQAAFLGATLGPDAVWLYGDPEETQPGRVRLCPPNWLHASGERFDVALNTDSMTEMSANQAIEYFRYLNQNCRALVSINHEANEIPAHEFPRMAGFEVPVLRSEFTLRSGYAEEIFFFDSNLAPAGREVPVYEPASKKILNSRTKLAKRFLELMVRKSFR